MNDSEKLEIAIGALADIAFATDMTLERARKKAKRIYEELRADELAEEEREHRELGGEEEGKD